MNYESRPISNLGKHASLFMASGDLRPLMEWGLWKICFGTERRVKYFLVKLSPSSLLPKEFSLNTIFILCSKSFMGSPLLAGLQAHQPGWHPPCLLKHMGVPLFHAFLPLLECPFHFLDNSPSPIPASRLSFSLNSMKPSGTT